jgi:hypothetical protein
VRRRCGSASWRSAAFSNSEDSAPHRSVDEANGLVRRKGGDHEHLLHHRSRCRRTVRPWILRAPLGSDRRTVRRIRDDAPTQGARDPADAYPSNSAARSALNAGVDLVLPEPCLPEVPERRSRTGSRLVLCQGERRSAGQSQGCIDAATRHLAGLSRIGLRQ